MFTFNRRRQRLPESMGHLAFLPTAREDSGGLTSSSTFGFVVLSLNDSGQYGVVAH